jgi:hypothetical protein
MRLDVRFLASGGQANMNNRWNQTIVGYNLQMYGQLLKMFEPISWTNLKHLNVGSNTKGQNTKKNHQTKNPF